MMQEVDLEPWGGQALTRREHKAKLSLVELVAEHRDPFKGPLEEALVETCVRGCRRAS